MPRKRWDKYQVILDGTRKAAGKPDRERKLPAKPFYPCRECAQPPECGKQRFCQRQVGGAR